ncbi:glutamyl-tRNA reductase [Terriglobus roseus DSM 18391]|uniref:Glutamyl-tRNA reductase n=1 Tax=Terriglobus roseus (strain DSM 18391 / NRRL B-41598 / KBS 63) TaxID=926566 RepID=I3ZHV6_TERRK|nr:glutamyl-tRNA reductase [Terriglobus roseus]AFL88483.1 glutamyl-tRNA reductase [Terriglobus roseus DSM 18391]AFL88824.1 glutamyl-tRNA reductase [Terriglobus roseus DSM 18391]
MSLSLLGVNHNSAPIDVRERLAIAPGRLADATRSLVHHPGVREGLILSTCNRVELLMEHESASDLRSFLSDYFAVPTAVLAPHLYEFREQEAIRHLFRVASSLDSMVVGEPQILGQVKESYTVAREVGAVSSTLERLLQSAFTVAKKVRTETEIGSSSVSIASVAADLAKQIFGSLKGKQVLLVGAGKMSELAARHLIAQGASSILVANRTPERAQRLAEQFHGLAVPFADLQQHAPKADIIVTGTGAREHLFNVREAQAILHARRGRPVFFIDIAVPRDVDPAVNGVDGAFVYSVDDLQQVAAKNMNARAEEAAAAEQIVSDEVDRFAARLQTLDAIPGILALQQHAEQLRLSELDRARAKLNTLTPEQQEAVDALTRSMMNKFLHAPMTGMRRSANEGDSATLTIIQRLFSRDR